MPIYDYNGTSNIEIGKIYDYNGTTNNQIGKVYDYDGTTNYLIYSANLEVVPDINTSHFKTAAVSSSGASVNVNGTLGMSAYAAGDNTDIYAYGMIRTTSAIDFSQYTKLTIVGSGTKYDGYDTHGHICVAGKTTAQDYISGYAGSNSGTVCTESWNWGSYSLMTTGGTNNFTQTYNISSVTGKYYLYFWCSAYAWMGTSMTITSVIFE